MSSEMSESIFLMQIFLLIIAGPLWALGFKSGWAQKQFAKRKAKFESTGKGKDPESDPYGPHKGMGRNFIAGTIFALLLGVVLRLGAGMAG